MHTAQTLDAVFNAVSSRFGHVVFHATVDLRRRFTREEMIEAVEATLGDFPILGCRYEQRFWRDVWVPIEGASSLMVHEQRAGEDLDADTEAWVHRRLDPARDPSLRVVILTREGGCRLVVSLLHIAVDGGGGMAVAQSLGAHLYGKAPLAPTSDERGISIIFKALGLMRMPLLAVGVAWQSMLAVTIYRAQERVRAYEADPSGPMGWRHLDLSPEQTARFKARCKAAGGSINDGLIAVLSRGVQGRTERGPLPVGYTVDLRRFVWPPRLLASNLSGIALAFVERGAGGLDGAIASAARTTRLHRRFLMGPAYVVGPATLVAAPHAYVRVLSRFIASHLISPVFDRALVLTNIGRLDAGLEVFGDDIEAVHIIGPLLEGVPMPFVCAIGFGGGLSLQVVGPPGMSARALDLFIHDLQEALELQ